MRTTIDLKSKKYGNFTIDNYAKNKVVIWWDFYDEQDGFVLEPNCNIYEDCDIKDFSDLPEEGIFKTIENAKSYLIKKFGKLK
jgi:hypothetical protein